MTFVHAHLETVIFLMSSIPSDSYILSESSSAGFLELGEKEFDGDNIFRADCSYVSHSLHDICFQVSVFVPICCKGEDSLMITDT